MSNMSRRGFKGRALVLPLQVQWQHQIRAPSLLDGMVVSLAEETLRIMQDLFPFYQTLPSSDAQHCSSTYLPPASRNTYTEELCDVGAMASRCLRMARLGALVHADCVERSILGWRWGLDKLATDGETSCAGCNDHRAASTARNFGC